MTPARRPSQATARTFYFLFFAAIAALLPFLVVFYQALGLDGREIGLLSAMLPLATLAVGPLWGALADASGRHRWVASAALAGTAAAGVAVASGRDLATLLPLVAVFAVFFAPIVPLTDTAVLAGLGDERERYGRLRAWGAVGFGLASLVAGAAVDRFGLAVAFASFGVLLVLALGVAQRLAWQAVAGDGAALRAPTAAASPISAGTGPRALHLPAIVRDFLTARWAALLVAGLLGGAAMAPTGTFLFLYLAERGAGASAVGIALALATASEIPVMFFAARWLARIRPRVLLLASLAIFALRLALYGTLDSTAGLLAVQLLHGPSFALLIVAGVARADRLALPGRRATGQALFTAAVLGMGGVIGSLGGGALYGALGPRPTFLVAAAVLATATALLAAWRVDDG
jgi:PPP family 3-phenylpropionic acid transporter